MITSTVRGGTLDQIQSQVDSLLGMESRIVQLGTLILNAAQTVDARCAELEHANHQSSERLTGQVVELNTLKTVPR